MCIGFAVAWAPRVVAIYGQSVIAGNAVCCKCHVYDVSSPPLRVRTRQRIRRHLSIFTATSCLCVTMPWGNTSIVIE